MTIQRPLGCDLSAHPLGCFLSWNALSELTLPKPILDFPLSDNVENNMKLDNAGAQQK